ncbi:MAG TPA: hypothetical protein ENN21_04760, partial [Spirochaetes bacterium]|nr:hypothetical protein [Spirochaetota bacterium]
MCLLPRSGAYSGTRNPFQESLPFSPASSMANLSAPLINPVFADYSGAAMLGYRPFSLGDGSWNHQALLGFYGFTFGYTRFNRLYDPALKKTVDAGATLGSVARGFMFGNTFGFGLGYGFSEGSRNYDGYSGFSFGLLFRPASFLSLGYTVRDFNGPSLNGVEIMSSQTCSLSLRPVGERLTLSIDAVRYGNRGFDERDIFLTAEILFPLDITLYAAGTMRENYHFGITMPLEFQSDSGGTLVLDYLGSRIRKSGPWMAAPGISIVGDKYRSPLVAGKAFLKIEMRGEIKENPEDRLFQETPLSFHDIIQGVDEASRDGSIAGILMVVDDTSLGFAQVQELRARLKSFRQS